jgi:gamma-glutamyltranspeptidase / glutathione hydrolase
MHHDPVSMNRRDLLRSLGLASAPLALPMGALDRVFAQESKSSSRVATSMRGVVATVHPLATQAAMRAYAQGGNAMDAAVAASLMLSVVDGHNSGLGGGCLALIRTAAGKVHAVDGRERAPLAASPEMFFRDGKPDPQLSQVGPLAAGVPGLLAALHQISQQHGRISWSGGLKDAAETAANGFAIDRNYAGNLKSSAQQLRQFAESKRILLDGEGNAWNEGDILRQPDLANTLQKIAEHGSDWFYRGEFADRLASFMRASGGVMTAQDLSDYKPANREAIETNYRNHRVVGFPPPSSGGIHIAQMLGMLSRFDVRRIFEDSPATGLHLLLEVMKRAMADRAYWLGDADFASVPLGLLDPDYLADRAADIDLLKSTPVASHGNPPHADTHWFGDKKHTTHLTAADAEGNVVAMTQTVNTSFGCKMIVPGTGVILNNEMDDFSIAPGIRNAFGLVGSAANLVAPGKRPLSSMSPTLVLNAANQPVMTCGAAGGPKIITTVLQILVRVLDLGQSIDEALAAARVHHQWSPDKAVCENAVPQADVEELTKRGHDVNRIASGAVAQGIYFATSGLLTAASDPRVPSSAGGV